MDLWIVEVHWKSLLKMTMVVVVDPVEGVVSACLVEDRKIHSFEVLVEVLVVLLTVATWSACVVLVIVSGQGHRHRRW